MLMLFCFGHDLLCLPSSKYHRYLSYFLHMKRGKTRSLKPLKETRAPPLFLPPPAPRPPSTGF